MMWSQDSRESDNEFWTGFTYRLHLHKRWRAELEQQLRLQEDWGTFKMTFTEAGMRYEVSEGLDLKLLYRYTLLVDDHNEQRWSLDLKYEYDIKNVPIDLIYRLRFQDEKVFYTGEKKTGLRNLFSIDYNMSKLADPFVEYESFYRFNEKNEFRVDRFTLGVEWKLNKQLDLESFYRMDRQKNVDDPETQHIIGLRFSYTGKTY